MRQAVTILVLLGAVLCATGQEPELWGEDKTLSPYFMVKSEDPSVDRLPLLETKAEADIAGVIADVTVTQVYTNEGQKPIEAVYVFPASTRAAVYGMKMTIGERVLIAEIREREQARREYEEAKAEGKSASLLEQQRPNVFQMNVANIMPGDTILVELTYTELLVPTGGVYEFTYPTVVGPRYTTAREKGAADTEKWTATPYQHEGEGPLYDFDLAVDISAGMRIQAVDCKTHKIKTAYDRLDFCRVTLDESEQKGGNRDFILHYRLTGGQIQTGLLLYEGKDENFFLLMVQPPERVTEADIPGREFIFIMDVSGSMHGFPIDVSKKVLRDLITNLRPTDVFNVLLFAGDNAVMADKSVAADEKNVEAALTVIDQQPGAGGTEILPALKRALALPRTEGMARTVVIVTDGYVSVEPEVFDLIRDNLGDANMFAFGIGSGVNRHIIEGMAHVGQGEPFVITKQEGAEAEAERFRKYIQSPVLTGVKVEFTGFEVSDVEPRTFPDVLAERPVIVFGKYRGEAKGKIKVTGLTGRKRYEQAFDVGPSQPDETNAALRYLWARDRIRMLDDYASLRGRSADSTVIKEVTELGLKYHLMTQYTSFVAVDHVIRNVDGKPTLVKQTLPLPEGVSDYAVGGAEPGIVGMQAAVRTKGMPVASEELFLKAATEGATVRHAYEAETGGIVTIGSASISPGSGRPELRHSKMLGAFEKKLDSILPELELLYEAELTKKQSLKGEVRVEAVVGVDGAVTGVSVKKNELNDVIRQRVEELVSGLAIENPASEMVTITVLFKFTP
jgi:Ca-activated chloride channel family protein